MTLQSCSLCKAKFRMNLVLKRLNKNSTNKLCTKCYKTKQPKIKKPKQAKQSTRKIETEPIRKTEITKNEPSIMELIDKDSDEYISISKIFSCSKDILRIEKNTNNTLINEYNQMKNNIETEKILFHGSHNTNYDDILRYGFDIGYSKPTGLMGQGIYFSSSSSYSDVYSWPINTIEHGNIKVLLICTVLTGKTTQGNFGLTQPPIGYDSVGNGQDMYVIFNKAQAYPKYLIYYIA